MADALSGPFQAAPDLVTSAAIGGDRVVYEVVTGDALYQESLRHIGFHQADARTFTRRLSARGDVAAIHRRFAGHLEIILLQSARRAPVDWQGALRLAVQRLAPSGLDWFLYGSAALAARGIDVSPGDLDLWVGDAELAGRLFADLLIEPVTTMTGWVADKGGRAYAGAIVEWLSGVHPGGAPHEQDPAQHGRREVVAWEGLTVPVAPLALQLAVAERRGLSERAGRIRAFMDRRR